MIKKIERGVKKGISFILVLLLVLGAVPAAIYAQEGTLDPSNLAGGNYTIRNNDGNIILEDENYNFCSLWPNTQLKSTGDLILNVETEVVISGIVVNSGKLIVNGSQTLTVNNFSDNDAVWASNGLEVNGSLKVIAPYAIAVGGGETIIDGSVSVEGLLWMNEDLTVRGKLACLRSNDTVAIVTEYGDITIDGGQVTIADSPYNGIYLPEGSLTIKNSGSLEVRDTGLARDEDMSWPALWIKNDINVESGAILKVNENRGTGISIYDGGFLIDSGAVEIMNNDFYSIIIGDLDATPQNHLTITNNGTLHIDGNYQSLYTVADVNVLHGGELTVKGSELDGITISDADLNIDGGIVTATNNDLRGMQIWHGNVTISNGGSLDVTNNKISGDAHLKVNGGDIIITDGYLIGGSETKNSGVYADGSIYVNDNSELTGLSSDCFGVYATGQIVADGKDALVKGIAVNRGNSTMSETAAVYAEETLSALNGGNIREEYISVVLSFDDTTPQEPYKKGANIADIANYTWGPGVKLTGEGLLAARNYLDVQNVVGTRMGDADGEIVSLDEESTHQISIRAKLATTAYSLTYKANGGEGKDITESFYAGDTIVVKANTFTAQKGYEFKEWNTQADGKGTSYIAGKELTPIQSVTLYAVWENVPDTDTDTDTDTDSDTDTDTETKKNTQKDKNNDTKKPTETGKGNDKTGSARTGDNSKIFYALMLLFASSLLMAVMIWRRREKHIS